MFTFETTDEKEARRFRMAQFNGRTATVKSGNETIIGHVRSELDISCLPRDLPEFIEVDLSHLTAQDTVHARDLKLPPGVAAALRGKENPVVVSVTLPVVQQEEEVAPTEEAAAAAAAAPGAAAPAAPAAAGAAAKGAPAAPAAAKAAPAPAPAAKPAAGEKKK